MNVQNSLNTDLGFSLNAMLPKIPGLDLESLLKFTIEPKDTQAILDVQKNHVVGASTESDDYLDTRRRREK